jgi:hypothetical protein
VYRIRLFQAAGPPQIREVVEFMSFTRRQILGGLAGLLSLVSEREARRVTGWARWPTPTRGMTTS